MHRQLLCKHPTMSKKRSAYRTVVGRTTVKDSCCGLCGRHRTLTKTHVPPQCAGNTGSVKRFTIVSDKSNRIGRQGQRIGGIHFLGLCAECNSGLQEKWDRAYCSFAKGLWPFALGGRLSIAAPRVQMPSMDILPGAIARSVLVSCFALNPNLRTTFKKLADDLVAESRSIELPDDTALFVGVTRGPHALVTGSMTGFRLLERCPDGSPLGTLSFAQIYFPPLAWQFVSVSSSPLLAKENWADASTWLLRDPTDVENLSSVLPSLPLVTHPSFAPESAALWSELFHDDSCFIVKSDDAIATIRAKFGLEV